MYINSGLDVNQPGGSNYPRVAIPQGQSHAYGIVEKVILNDKSRDYDKQTGANVGEILVRRIPAQSGKDLNKLETALPLDGNSQRYPVVGETVFLYSVPNGPLFYTNPINLQNDVTGNSNPVLYTNSRNNSVVTQEHRELRGAGVNIPLDTNNTPVQGEEQFTQSGGNVYKLRSNVGDILFQGRYGNSIRLGSSLFDPNSNETNVSANILLTAGQWRNPIEVSTSNPTRNSLTKENINEDITSIWMVANQTIDFAAATSGSQNTNPAHLRSSGSPSRVYNGAQIFINSGRVVLNSKQSEISLFSANDINLSALNNVTIDTENKVFVNANEVIDLESKTIDIFGRESVTITSEVGEISSFTRGKQCIIGKEIFIGTNEDRSEPMVLGASLAIFLQQLITTLTVNLNTGIVVTPSGPGTISFPSLIAALNGLSIQGLGAIPQAASFNSRSNFTTRKNSV